MQLLVSSPSTSQTPNYLDSPHPNYTVASLIYSSVGASLGASKGTISRALILDHEYLQASASSEGQPLDTLIIPSRTLILSKVLVAY
jgi:hypothetical protein